MKKGISAEKESSIGVSCWQKVKKEEKKEKRKSAQLLLPLYKQDLNEDVGVYMLHCCLPGSVNERV